MKLPITVGKLYKIKDQDCDVRITDVFEEGVAAILCNDYIFQGRIIHAGAWVGITLQDLQLDGENADFECLFHSMDEVM